jgi:type VI secretion system protein ImpC
MAGFQTMPQSMTHGHLRVDLSFQSAGDSIPGDDETFFPIAILGDFSGRTRRLESSFSADVVAPIDCENFESVLGKLDVALRLQSAEPGSEKPTVWFRRLEDFHPDELIQQIEPLSRLFELRARLLDPARAEAAVAESRAILKMPVSGANPLPSASTETTEELLTRLLGKPAATKSERTPTGSTVEQLIKQIVAPSVVPGTSTEQSQLVRFVESELSARLRDVLHDPNFQALEAAWRGIDFLVRETGDQIKIFLFDITKAELAVQVLAGDLAKTAIFKHLEQISPAVVLGLYTFGLDDQALLRALGSLAEALRTAFVAGASPQMVGCRSFGLQPDPDDWVNAPPFDEFDLLRRTPKSAHLGLLMPRFLLRQPYGPNSDPIEAFPFQEMLAGSEHESYLWGNPSLLCGCLLADAFAAAGGKFDTPRGGQIFGLPVHAFIKDGETQAKPCAEAWLTEKAAEVILNHGIMPVASIRGRDAVEVKTLQAFSVPPKSLIIRYR